MAELTIKIDIGDETDADILEAIALNAGYQSTLRVSDGSEIANPETAESFALKQIQRFLRDHLQSRRVNRALEEAKKTIPEPKF